jgi:hypothetical protein
LSAFWINETLKTSGVDDLDLTLAKNADNLLCASASSLGQGGKIAILVDGQK